MTSAPTPDEDRIWDPATSVVFWRTRAAHGWLSNMCGGYPLRIKAHSFPTSEHLYCALRYRDARDGLYLCDIASPIDAKRASHTDRALWRADWDDVKREMMRKVLYTKLVQHPELRRALAQTGDLPIVEKSLKDAWWGATPADDGLLAGKNVLGRLWMDLRGRLKDDHK